MRFAQQRQHRHPADRRRARRRASRPRSASSRFISWSGLDIGRDRLSPVSHYEAPFAFTGKLRKVTMTMDDDQALDAEAAATAALARE